MFSLDGRRALVTGGSSGIGRAMAAALAAAGAEVVLVARTAADLEAAAADTGAAGWVAGDLADRTQVERVLDEVGDVDVLLNAAGLNLRPPLGDLSDGDWDAVVEVNLTAPFLLGRGLGPAMAARGWGRIINVGSQQTWSAFGNSGGYGAAKAGLAGLTRSQAEAWSPHGVTANCVVPAFVRTAMTERIFVEEPERAEAMARRTLVGRNGTPDDYRGIAVFLASDAAAFVTGQTIGVDGGFSVS